jgi:HK97 family phage major capsid protein
VSSLPILFLTEINMSKKIIELQEKRLKAVHDARALNDSVAAEKRDMTGEEQTRFNAFMADQEKLGQAIKDEQRLLDAERETAAGEQRGGKTTTKADDGAPTDKRASAEYAEAFGAFLRAENQAHQRALQADLDTDGGYVVSPRQFVTALIKSIDDQSFVRQNATVLPLNNAASLGVPSLDADPADADWTSELGTGNEDSAMKFGAREFKPLPLAKRIKISKKLLRSSAIPIEQLVQERLAYKFAVTQEKAFMLGNGAGQPLGLFAASTNGITTARDVATGNTTSAVTMDGLINAKYSLKSGYLANAKWLFHRDGVREVAKLKDNDGSYLWQPSKTEGEPDMLLGQPIIMSEYVPNTFTTGQYVGIIGDLSYYWIADALDMQIQALFELYAEANQVGYIARMETDGMPVLAEAFARVKLA